MVVHKSSLSSPTDFAWNNYRLYQPKKSFCLTVSSQKEQLDFWMLQFDMSFRNSHVNAEISQGREGNFKVPSMEVFLNWGPKVGRNVNFQNALWNYSLSNLWTCMLFYKSCNTNVVENWARFIKPLFKISVIFNMYDKISFFV